MQCKMETINKMCNEWANYGNALRKCGKTQEKQRQSRGKESLIKCQICQVDCQNQAPAHEYRYQRYMKVDENILWHFNTSEIRLLCVRVCVAGCFQSVCIIVKRKWNESFRFAALLWNIQFNRSDTKISHLTCSTAGNSSNSNNSCRQTDRQATAPQLGIDSRSVSFPPLHTFLSSG